MLSISFEECQETIAIGDLFREMGFERDAAGAEKITECFWDLRVRSLDEYYDVEGCRWTVPEPVFHLAVETSEGCVHEMICADKHLVLKQAPDAWVHVDSLKMGDRVVCKTGVGTVVAVDDLTSNRQLCDFQVEIAHSYYTNGIFSHNSHYLVSMGAAALKLGFNVVHYTFELSETVVGTRYDSHLCRISATDVPDSRDIVLEEYKQMKDLGRLIIKEYPTGSASITTLRNHIEKLLLKGIKPDILVIDYADIMRSSRKYDSMRHELKLIYEELRALAVDFQVPIWTASQANRDASNSEVVGLENMSEAYGKAMVADFICAISRKPNEKLMGGARLHVAKNRAGRDGFVFPIKIDTSQSRIEVMDEIAEMTLEEVNQGDSSSMKDLLRKKWKEVQESKETV